MKAKRTFTRGDKRQEQIGDFILICSGSRKKRHDEYEKVKEMIDTGFESISE